MATVTVAALQTSLTDDVDTNVARVEALVREAAGQGAQIILPSELFEGEYFCRGQAEADFDRARAVADHPTLAKMSALAAELGVVIPVSFYEQDGPERYNSIAVIDADGRSLGVYRKSHIPDGPGYQEKFFFKPGNTGFGAFRTRYATIGVAICWDQWFPEAARLTAMQGASVIFYPTAIGWHPAEKDLYGEEQWNKWQTVMRGHAVANNVFIAAPNRIGLEPHDDGGALEFFGHSFICDTSGRYIEQVDEHFEGILQAIVDPNKVEKQRQYWPFFRDRRIDAYAPLLGHPTRGS